MRDTAKRGWRRLLDRLRGGPSAAATRRASALRVEGLENRNLLSATPLLAICPAAPDIQIVKETPPVDDVPPADPGDDLPVKIVDDGADGVDPLLYTCWINDGDDGGEVLDPLLYTCGIYDGGDGQGSDDGAAFWTTDLDPIDVPLPDGEAPIDGVVDTTTVDDYPPEWAYRGPIMYCLGGLVPPGAADAGVVDAEPLPAYGPGIGGLQTDVANTSGEVTDAGDLVVTSLDTPLTTVADPQTTRPADTADHGVTTPSADTNAALAFTLGSLDKQDEPAPTDTGATHDTKPAVDAGIPSATTAHDKGDHPTDVSAPAADTPADGHLDTTIDTTI
ncbi:MAG: hypothetical protein U0736_21925 [Gemmataceae bacterium]